MKGTQAPGFPHLYFSLPYLSGTVLVKGVGGVEATSIIFQAPVLTSVPLSKSGSLSCLWGRVSL